MKNTILFLGVIATMASCNNSAQQQAATQARQVDSLKNEMAKQHIIDSMNVANAQPAATTAQQPVVAGPSHTTHTYYHTTTNGGAVAQTAAAPAPAAKKQRKGLGAVAAGTIIGAGAGAITGAMVDGRKGEGAVVGGLIGAGAGAGTGAIIKKQQQKKDGQ